MKSRARLLSAVVAGAFMFVVGTPTAHALSDVERKCQENIGKSGRKFFKKKLKTIQKCNDKNLKAEPPPDDCVAELPGKIADLEAKLDADIDAKCVELIPFHLAEMGFPGKCLDPDPSNGFTVAALKLCMGQTHEASVDD